MENLENIINNNNNKYFNEKIHIQSLKIFVENWNNIKKENKLIDWDLYIKINDNIDDFE